MKRIGQILVILSLPTTLLGNLFQNGDVWHDFLATAGFVFLAMCIAYIGIFLIDKAWYEEELREMQRKARRERMAQREEARYAEMNRQIAGKEMIAFLAADAEDNCETEQSRR